MSKMTRTAVTAVCVFLAVAALPACTSSATHNSCNAACQASVEAANRSYLASLSAAVSSSSKPDTSSDPAAGLAALDGSTDVAAYSAALDDWQARCTEDRLTLAGYVDGAYKDEQKHGGVSDDTSRLDVMRHLTDSVPTSAGQMKCVDIAAAYLTLVENGS